MISAEKAREITKEAQDREDTYVRATVEKESTVACKDIKRAAYNRTRVCEIDAHAFRYPDMVAAYLKTQLGYSAEYLPNSRVIRAAW